MKPRKYLPTFAELVDRLCIVLMKSIFIGPEYRDEADLIMHDINTYPVAPSAETIRAVIILALVNREIWLNESKARAGGSEQDHLLKFTHSLNGVRSRAKNVLAERMAERVDTKIDCFAAEFEDRFGRWGDLFR